MVRENGVTMNAELVMSVSEMEWMGGEDGVSILCMDLY